MTLCPKFAKLPELCEIQFGVAALHSEPAWDAKAEHVIFIPSQS